MAKPNSSFPGITSSSLPIGTRLGEFEITGVIGEGGFGIVYSAHDGNLDRTVAIKEYFPTAFAQRKGGTTVQSKSVDVNKAFSAGLSSFIMEAKMLARFAHPGLIEVFRFWEAHGTAYMAMRYYRGVTLRELMRTNPEIVTEQWLCETLDPLLLALKELHAQDCYHRDIAPDNILILPNGRSVLMDFGASRKIIGGITQSLTTVLKPGFAPIEQYSDDGSMAQGAWTDIYAIGGLLYNAMTGKMPAQAISRMISDPMKPVSALARGDFSPQLCRVVMKCMAVLPHDRYQSVDELRAALGWMTTPGVSQVVHAQPPFDPQATVRMFTPKPEIPINPQVLVDQPAHVRKEAGVLAPIVASDAPAEATLTPRRSGASREDAFFRLRAVRIAGVTLLACFVVGVAAWLINKPSTPVAKSTLPTNPVSIESGTAPVVASESRPLRDETSAAVPAGSTTAAPAKVDTMPVVVSGSIRFELKDGWATVFVDGESKGTAPPVITVKLAPGTHVIELRNPALPTVKQTITVTADKTVVVRHVFSK
jgi:non-specific serine/threonine protein kinase